MEPKGAFLVKARRIRREETGDGFVRHAGKRVVRETVPDTEGDQSSFNQNATAFANGGLLVRDEHQTELTGHGRKRSCGKRQGAGVRLLPLDILNFTVFLAGIIKHRLAQISSNKRRVRGDVGTQSLREDPGPPGRFQDRTVWEDAHTARQVSGERLEEDGTEMAVVHLGHRPRGPGVYVHRGQPSTVCTWLSGSAQGTVPYFREPLFEPCRKRLGDLARCAGHREDRAHPPRLQDRKSTR